MRRLLVSGAIAESERSAEQAVKDQRQATGRCGCEGDTRANAGNGEGCCKLRPPPSPPAHSRATSPAPRAPPARRGGARHAPRWSANHAPSRTMRTQSNASSYRPASVKSTEGAAAQKRLAGAPCSRIALRSTAHAPPPRASKMSLGRLRPDACAYNRIHRCGGGALGRGRARQRE